MIQRSSPGESARLRPGDVNSAALVLRLQQRLDRGLRERQRGHEQPQQRVPCPAFPQIITGVQMDSGYSFELLVAAYYDCRKNKRNTDSALRFEQDLERNLIQLHKELTGGTYRPERSICFVITRPKPREVWAAEFRDRIAHHLLYNQISGRFHRRFIADSCACIPGRGTLYGAQRLHAKIRSQTQNWSRPAHYLKLDLANFFVSIDKRVVWPLLARNILDPWWRDLAALILFHDPRTNYEYRGDPALLDLVQPHKRLLSAPPYHGLPIGNLSSQFFANVLLERPGPAHQAHHPGSPLHPICGRHGVAARIAAMAQSSKGADRSVACPAWAWRSIRERPSSSPSIAAWTSPAMSSSPGAWKRGGARSMPGWRPSRTCRPPTRWKPLTATWACCVIAADTTTVHG